MQHDPLAQYRRTPLPPTDGTLPPKEADGYTAFGTKDKVYRLRIRSVMDVVDSPGYNILLTIHSDGEKGTCFVLVYTVMVVRVQGRNLQKAVFAIENAMADYIQEFDPDKWQKPTDASAAFIESIEIKVTSNHSADTEAAH
jgi:hypothetical protein